MTIARNQQISLEHTPYYHCTVRCVRRAFLCGKDRYSGKNYNHRKRWLEGRLKFLAQIFAIDLLAYAIMSNHYHVVVRLNVDRADAWSDEDIKERWRRLFSLPANVPTEKLALWRHRLADLSWYMRCLNEPLARRANREDECKGRFWEGRFRCQALLDELAVLKCMTYVDLNPIRAAITRTPEASAHTSIKARIQGDDSHLLPFSMTTRVTGVSVPIEFREYLELIEWTGRQLKPGKRGRIPAELPSILERLAIPANQWVRQLQYYGSWYSRAVGSLDALEIYCRHLGQRWLKGARYHTSELT